MNYRMGMKLSMLSLALTMFGWGQTPNAPGNASVVATWQTASVWNGRFWRTLTEGEKYIFLFGYSTAVGDVTIRTTTDFEHYKGMIKAFWPRSLTVAEVHSSLDRLYDTPENG